MCVCVILNRDVGTTPFNTIEKEPFSSGSARRKLYVATSKYLISVENCLKTSVTKLSPALQSFQCYKVSVGCLADPRHPRRRSSEGGRKVQQRIDDKGPTQYRENSGTKVWQNLGGRRTFGKFSSTTTRYYLFFTKFKKTQSKKGYSQS